MSNVNDPISRRRALALGGGLAVASAPLLGASGRALAATARGGIDVTGKAGNGRLPVQQIEAIMQTTGMMSTASTIRKPTSSRNSTGRTAWRLATPAIWPTRSPKCSIR